MPRILFDQNTPLRLRNHLKEHEVVTVRDMGWEGAPNDALTAAAGEHGFDALIAANRNPQYTSRM
jgi:Domain of unknown function (DUF5615)